MQLLPDARVRPVLDVVVRRALQVEPRQRRRAHRVKRKAAIVIGIDQLVFRRRRFRQHPDPAERIFAIIGREHTSWNARPAYAVKAVAAADEVAGELLVLAVVPEPDFRCLAGEVVNADVARLEQDLATIRKAPVDQILHHLLLAVDGHALADELAEIDVVQGAAEAEIDAIVEHSLALHARAHADFNQQVARPLLDQSGADAALDIVAAAVLQHDGLDARQMQEMRQHQPGRSCPDDTDLRPHSALLLIVRAHCNSAPAREKRRRRDCLALFSGSSPRDPQPRRQHLPPWRFSPAPHRDRR